MLFSLFSVVSFALCNSRWRSCLWVANVSNVIDSIMLWCIIMLIQLCSYFVCSYSFNLSVKVVID